MPNVSVHVALDVYPATVTLPSGAVLQRARLFVADAEVLVYILSNGSPVLYFQRQLLSSEGGSSVSGINLQVEDGTVKVRKSGGCGCGSRLKSFNPWPGATRVRVAL